MTHLPPGPFTLTVFRDPRTLTVGVGGELDHDTGDDLLHEVTTRLTAYHPPPRDVRLDFRELTFIDSSGLAVLLMIHRHAGALGATLHLDHRPAHLERMLHVTNVLDHLTAPPARTGVLRTEEGEGFSGTGVP
ncbi:STAS domain-containing protein [Streptomyces sp. NPDC001046]|uniref:STAS domain-containing protein n=1 Tax=Streptomyces sp. NPDC001046 TaxID=3364543 RepID=UPI0036AC010D